MGLLLSGAPRHGRTLTILACLAQLRHSSALCAIASARALEALAARLSLAPGPRRLLHGHGREASLNGAIRGYLLFKAIAQIDAHDLAVGQRLCGRAAGDDATGIEHHYLPAQGPGGMHNMLDHDNGETICLQRAHELDAGLELRGIESSQPFVE